MSVPRILSVLALAGALGVGLRSQYSADAVVARRYADQAVQAAISTFERDYDRLVADIIAITEVPAPTFAEEKRAALVEALFRETRPTSLERDAAGNVLALRRGATGSGPLVVIAAHLDTVFPPGTGVTVRRTGTTLAAPGIGDNSVGVAFLVALSRAMDAAGVKTASDVLFVANVGEEGLGDLQGMKHLFGKGRFKDRIRTFVTVDGAGDGTFVATTAVGSRRYRVTFRGPGGHSFGAFGLVNPAHAVAAAVQTLSTTRVPSSPRTTFNVGAIGGGTSVNSIPSSAWMEVDLRSEGSAELDALDRTFRSAVTGAADAENAVRSVSEGQITSEITATGARPAGRTPPGSRLVTTVSAVWRMMRLTPVFGANSSDANLPMSLGIPAVAIDTGIPGGRPHSPDEWIDVDRTYARAGLERLLLLTMSLAGTGN